jgi:phosphopantetheinyl transferase
MLLCCDGIRVALDRIPEEGDRGAAVQKLCAAISCDARDIRVEKDDLGAPRLVGKGPMPVVSFCSSKGERWIAVAWAEGVGVDVSCPDEFEPPYPYARVFRETEVRSAASLGLESLSGYALLWSLKEAAAKVLGTGFNGVEPGEFIAGGLRMTEQGIEAEITAPEAGFGALSVPVDDCWLALSVRKG